MTIDKAIEIIQDIVLEGRGLSGDDRFDALKLGIEAMKQVQNNRLFNIDISYIQLPGETQE